MRSRSQLKKIFLLALVSTTALFGCELIVDFDRTLIVSETVPEAGPTEASTPDTGGSDSAVDSPTTTDASDAGPDVADTGADVQDAADSG